MEVLIAHLLQFICIKAIFPKRRRVQIFMSRKMLWKGLYVCTSLSKAFWRLLYKRTSVLKTVGCSLYKPTGLHQKLRHQKYKHTSLHQTVRQPCTKVQAFLKQKIGHARLKMYFLAHTSRKNVQIDFINIYQLITCLHLQATH